MHEEIVYYRKYKNISLEHIIKKYNLDDKQCRISPIRPDKIGRVCLIEDLSNNKKYILKQMLVKKTRFPILLQQELNKLKMAPKVYLTVTGEVYILKSNYYFFLIEYVENLTYLNTEQRIQALAIFHQMAKFEKLMKIKERVKYWRLTDFLREYRQKIQDLVCFQRKIKSPSLNNKLNELIHCSKLAYTLFIKSNLKEYLKYVKENMLMKHGDFHSRNVFFNEEKRIMFIDFDRSAFAPPLEDFRFLLHSILKNVTPPQSKQMEAKIDLLFKDYFSHNPNENKYKSIYFIDSLFPHQFYRQIRRRKTVTNHKSKTLENELIHLAEKELLKAHYILIINE